MHIMIWLPLLVIAVFIGGVVLWCHINYKREEECLKSMPVRRPNRQRMNDDDEYGYWDETDRRNDNLVFLNEQARISREFDAGTRQMEAMRVDADRCRHGAENAGFWASEAASWASNAASNNDSFNTFNPPPSFF